MTHKPTVVKDGVDFSKFNKDMPMAKEVEVDHMAMDEDFERPEFLNKIHHDKCRRGKSEE